MVGLARRGHIVRALAPITDEAARADDAYAVGHPDLAITRFAVPYYHVAPQTPAPEAYRRREEVQIQSMLTALLGARRPDLLFVGRERSEERRVGKECRL